MRVVARLDSFSLLKAGPFPALRNILNPHNSGFAEKSILPYKCESLRGGRAEEAFVYNYRVVKGSGKLCYF
jgi:hypothetical protein